VNYTRQLWTFFRKEIVNSLFRNDLNSKSSFQEIYLLRRDKMEIQELLDKYESFKLKGLQLNEQDMFDWLDLQDKMEDMIIELKSKYAEDELVFDRDY
jgi:predicted nuclease with TOPRIM domain